MKIKPGTLFPLLVTTGLLCACVTACQSTAPPRGGSYSGPEQPNPKEAFYYGGPNYGGGDVIDASLPGKTPPRRSAAGR